MSDLATFLPDAEVCDLAQPEGGETADTGAGAG